MRPAHLSLFVLSLAFVPATAFALPGVGPRAAFEGTVESVTITPKQAEKEQGGTMMIRADDGQLVTADITDNAQILFEGKRRSSRYKPADILVGMSVRVRGWRKGSDAVDASLITILNIEKASSLSFGGTVQSIGSDGITVLLGNGDTRTLSITNETEVNVDYKIFGSSALFLIGKAINVTVNPKDTTQARIMRIFEYKPQR